jgi:hypothetical protein
MTEMTSNTPGIQKYLADPIEVGEPDVVGPLAVFPLFGPDPKQHYLSFAEGRANGARVTELEASASVSDLLIDNPGAEPVLLYEGEEVLGAQQNRTFDVTVLVPAQAKLRVPVSCVEVGRWDGRRHAEDFDVSPQAAYPDLRRAKSRQVGVNVAMGREARANQPAVWDEIAAKSARHRAQSPTGAMHDVFASRRHALLTLTGGVRRRDAQVGALGAIAGQFAVLDWVSRADVFAALHGPLVQGYALDALEASDVDAPSTATTEDARAFASRVVGTAPTERDSIGLGRDLRFAAADVAGSGLVSESELIQLTAFPEDVGGGAPWASERARVSRPSRRGR